MTNTFTITSTSTFTRTSAQYIASKVAADLRRLSRFYGRPSDGDINNYHDELVEYLLHDLLDSVEYGFVQNNQRVVSLKYIVQYSGGLSDSHAGGVYARADISGASWFSFLCSNYNWTIASQEERDKFHQKLPFIRQAGTAPSDGQGVWTIDRSYSTDGRGTQRQIFKPY